MLNNIQVKFKVLYTNMYYQLNTSHTQCYTTKQEENYAILKIRIAFYTAFIYLQKK